MPGLTPSQTVGPFFAIALGTPGPARIAGPAGRRVHRRGSCRDGAGAAVPDALVESWQADHAGHHAPADDGVHRVGGAPTPTPRGATRSPRSCRARRRARRVLQASHLLLGVFARGLLNRLVTRAYFEGEPGWTRIPVLQCVSPARRHTLIARSAGDGQYELDIVLQGDEHHETVFFDV